MTDEIELEYVGFWLRAWAAIIDTVLILMLISPLKFLLMPGQSFSYWHLLLDGRGDFWFTMVLPAVVVIAFWAYRNATPGKMMIGAKIVCSKTGRAPSLTQHIIRYIGYSISTAVFMLGWLWVAFDSRKQGWHDKLAGTVVVRPKSAGVKPVRFDR